MRGLMRKVRRDEGGFTLIELLIVIIILGVLAAVVAFNVGGFLGQGTKQTAQTEMASVQTAIFAAMANASVTSVNAGTPGLVADTTTTFTLATVGTTDYKMEAYLKLPTHGNWSWGTDGVITSGSYSGGGKTCSYDSNKAATEQWTCT